jgi:CRISPR system CASCADE complex protein casA
VTEPDYNLLDEGWIPVLLTDGGVERFGICDVFLRANDIADLACELPTQNMAIQRVLEAICYRVVPLEDKDDWKELWREGLPTDEILAYLERWRDRFYLFGGRYPFMQGPDLQTSKGTVSGLEKIIADIPNGEPFFTVRHGRAVDCISPDEAALWLLHAQAYDPSGIRSGLVDDPQSQGGKSYPTGPAWCGQTAMVWLRGASLEETLMLNLVPADSGHLQGPTLDSPEAACTWEGSEIETGVRRDYSREGDPEPNGIGIPRLLTWHSRRIRLVGDRRGVTGVVLAQGDKLGPQQMQRFEPMSLWRYSTPQSKKYRENVYMPAKHEPGRAFWRNLPAVLPVVELTEGFDKQKHPKFLQSATLLFHAGLDSSDLDDYPVKFIIEAVGMTYGPKEAVVADLYHDRLTVAVALLEDRREDLVYLANAQIRAIEEVASAAGYLGANLARAAGERGDGAGEGARDRARERFFAEIDDPFRVWLAGLHEDSRVDAEREAWSKQARGIAQRVADELIEAAPTSAIKGRETGMGYMSTGIAENFFRKQVNKVLPLPEASQNGEKK